MKKPKRATERMRDEYEFSDGARGKYARRYGDGSKVVVLDPDVARAFPDSAAVNAALRRLLHSEAKRKRPR